MTKRKSIKGKQHNDQKKKYKRKTTQWSKGKGETMIYRALFRKLTIKQHKPNENQECTQVPWKG